MAGVHSTVWDLGHHGCIYEASHVEQPRVVPIGVGVAQSVADGVVLPGEESVKHGETNPPVPCEAGLLNPLVVERQVAGVIKPQLASYSGSEPVQRLLIAAIYLRAVPPVSDLVDERYGGRFPIGHTRGIGLGPADEHLCLPVLLPRRIVIRKGNLVYAVAQRLPVMHPIVVLEVDPGGGQKIEEWHFLHPLSPGEEGAAQHSRIRCHQAIASLRTNDLVGNVAGEACARRSLFRVGRIVPGSIGGAEVFDTRRRRLFLRLKANQGSRRVGALEIVLVELIAHVGQGKNADEVWPAVPVCPHLVAVAGQSTQKTGHCAHSQRHNRPSRVSHH